MPTIFQDRLGISLHDAQYNSETGVRQPIAQDIIDQIIASLLRFKTVCADFGVLEENISILATEATRTAINSVEYRAQIKEKVGWEVKMLSKEDEGKVGAMGIASSLSTVTGLVMDLGGGSTQLTWMVAENGTVKTSPIGAVSMPYGAAAMKRRLEEVEKQGKDAKKELKKTITAQYKQAYQDLQVPAEIANSESVSLYLSGGGFRGWGYILLSEALSGQYPISTINGFEAPVSDFHDTKAVTALAASSITDQSAKVFRVSKRRASQVPGVAFLVNIIIDAIPIKISNIHFCQGGVREGYLFSLLPEQIRADHPLSVTTRPFSTEKWSDLQQLITSTIPSNLLSDPSFPLSEYHLTALAQSLYIRTHTTHPKDTIAAAALRSTTTGVLSSAHGLSHYDRAMLGLMLCARYGGDISPTDAKFRNKLREIAAQVNESAAWWAEYLGRCAGIIAWVYPAGRVAVGERVAFTSSWDEAEKTLALRVRFGMGEQTSSVVEMAGDVIEEMGDMFKKNKGLVAGFRVHGSVTVE